MTKEKYLERLAEIDRAIAQTMANLNMLEGGKQEILYWIKELETPDLTIKDIEKMVGADEGSIQLIDQPKSL